MKSPSECGRSFAPLWGWKLGDTEALRDERQLGRHAGYALRVDLLTIKAFSWKLPGGSGLPHPNPRDAGGQFKHPRRPSPTAQNQAFISWSRVMTEKAAEGFLLAERANNKSL